MHFKAGAWARKVKLISITFSFVYVGNNFLNDLEC